MPVHEFLLLPETDGNYPDGMDHVHSPHAIRVHDDLVLYIFDTLKWIPTINPGNSGARNGYGLNYHGVTIINNGGAAKAVRIFRVWAALLQEGPENFDLTGAFEWIEGESVSEGKYAKIAVARDSAVKSFQSIAEFAEKATSGEFYVLHIGI